MRSSRAVSDDDSGIKISVSPPPPFEESSQGLHGVFLGPSPPARVIHLFHAPGLPRRRCVSAPLHQENRITPRALFADGSPSLLVHPRASMPLFNTPRLVLVPPDIFSSVSVAHHKLFRPVLMSMPGPVSSRAPGAHPDPSLKLLPAPQMSVQRLFSCGPSGARALPANSSGHCPQHCSEEVKRDLPLQDHPESALDKYRQIMDDLGLEVTEGSAVTDEEDECAQYINQLLDDSQFMTEASLDMDFINYLLSSDDLKDDPKAVAGCSDWTCSTDSEAPPSDAQRDSRPFNRTDVLLTEDPTVSGHCPRPNRVSNVYRTRRPTFPNRSKQHFSPRNSSS